MRFMQPWLLQHYAGTPGFRIERMLTRLVAEKFTDHSGIDWAEIVSQHKELVGHTATSLGQAHQKVLFSKCQSRCLIGIAYQPGKERRKSAADAAHKEAVISH